jgi:hypothetical protein
VKKFEDLDKNIQALIFARLALELKTHHCTNLQGLAKKLQTDLMGAWRAICRRSGQPPCAIPSEIVQPR